MMRIRAAALLIAVAVLVWPIAIVDAQPPAKIYRIGVLGSTSAPAAAHLVEAFRQGMRENGWIEGQTYAMEFRWADGRADRLPALAAELVGRRLDVIFAGTNTTAAAAKQATSTIPIVMIGYDPVGSGFVGSLARPEVIGHPLTQPLTLPSPQRGEG